MPANTVLRSIAERNRQGQSSCHHPRGRSIQVASIDPDGDQGLERRMHNRHGWAVDLGGTVHSNTDVLHTGRRERMLDLWRFHHCIGLPIHSVSRSERLAVKQRSIDYYVVRPGCTPAL